MRTTRWSATGRCSRVDRAVPRGLVRAARRGRRDRMAAPRDGVWLVREHGVDGVVGAGHHGRVRADARDPGARAAPGRVCSSAACPAPSRSTAGALGRARRRRPRGPVAGRAVEVTGATPPATVRWRLSDGTRAVVRIEAGAGRRRPGSSCSTPACPTPTRWRRARPRGRSASLPWRRARRGLTTRTAPACRLSDRPTDATGRHPRGRSLPGPDRRLCSRTPSRAAERPGSTTPQQPPSPTRGCGCFRQERWRPMPHPEHTQPIRSRLLRPRVSGARAPPARALRAAGTHPRTGRDRPADGVVRAVPAPDAAGDRGPVADGRGARRRPAGLHLGHLRRVRLDARHHPGPRPAPARRDLGAADRAPDLRGGDPPRDRHGHRGVPRRGRPHVPRAARGPAGGQPGLDAAPRRADPRERARRAAPRGRGGALRLLGEPGAARRRAQDEHRGRRVPDRSPRARARSPSAARRTCSPCSPSRRPAPTSRSRRCSSSRRPTSTSCGTPAALGVTIPILAGVIPSTDPARLLRVEELTGVTVPADLLGRLLAADDEAERHRIGLRASIDLANAVLDGGAPGLHVYTFNRHRAALDLLEGAGLCDGVGTSGDAGPSGPARRPTRSARGAPRPRATRTTSSPREHHDRHARRTPAVPRRERPRVPADRAAARAQAGARGVLGRPSVGRRGRGDRRRPARAHPPPAGRARSADRRPGDPVVLLLLRRRPRRRRHGGALPERFAHLAPAPGSACRSRRTRRSRAARAPTCRSR